MPLPQLFARLGCMTPDDRHRRTRRLVVDGLAALLLLVVVGISGPGAIGDPVSGPLSSAALVLSALLLGAGIAVRRELPAVGLLLAWASTLVHMSARLDASVLQLGLLLVLYGAARYGSRRVLLLSGLSVGAGALVAIAYLVLIGSWVVSDLGFQGPATALLRLLITTAVLAVVLAVPWLLGLLGRTSAQAKATRLRQAEAEREAERSQQIADLSAERTALARDVHDIVGHSLAVIIAQSESVRFLHEREPGAVLAAVDTIAGTARRSLADVRRVLERTTDLETAQTGASLALDDLDRLIDDVAAARPALVRGEHGPRRALPPEVAAVAYRVTQELLTNALKHGDRSGELRLDRYWTAEALVVVVRNAVAGDAPPGADAEQEPAPGSGGQGVPGMRSRLAEVGGALEIELVEGTMTARASIPLPITTEEAA